VVGAAVSLRLLARCDECAAGRTNANGTRTDQEGSDRPRRTVEYLTLTMECEPAHAHHHWPDTAIGPTHNYTSTMWYAHFLQLSRPLNCCSR
jgi:hypothetical protein